MSRIQYANGREVKNSYNPLCHLQEMEDWLRITKIVTDPLGGQNFFDGLFIGSLNTSASVFAATVFGAPLPQNYIGTAGKIILNGGLNFVSGSLSSILLDGVNGDKINLTKSVYSGLLQGTVGGILGGAL